MDYIDVEGNGNTESIIEIKFLKVRVYGYGVKVFQDGKLLTSWTGGSHSPNLYLNYNTYLERYYRIHDAICHSLLKMVGGCYPYKSFYYWEDKCINTTPFNVAYFTAEFLNSNGFTIDIEKETKDNIRIKIRQMTEKEQSEYNKKVRKRRYKCTDQ